MAIGDMFLSDEEQKRRNQRRPGVTPPGPSLDNLLQGLPPALDSFRDRTVSAVDQFGLPGQSAGPTDPFQQLLQQLQGINVQSTPYEQLMEQARSSASAQFDPLIQQLQAEMETTKNRGQRNQQEGRQMYGDLATQIASQMPEITNRMAQASQQAEGRYAETQNELQGQYNNQAQQQAELFKRLGIQAAAPEASQQAMEDQAYFQNQLGSDKASALQALSQMGQADVSYNQQSSDNARLAGENLASDIGRQLEDYLQVSGGKLGGLQAGKESAIQAMLGQLQQQDSARMQQQEQKEYDRMMDMFNLQLKMQEMQNKENRSQKPLWEGTKGLPGASNFLSEAYGQYDPKATFGMDLIKDFLDDPEVTSGQMPLGQKDSMGQEKFGKVTNEHLANLLRQKAGSEQYSSRGFNDADINNLINALMAYYGELR